MTTWTGIIHAITNVFSTIDKNAFLVVHIVFVTPWKSKKKSGLQRGVQLFHPLFELFNFIALTFLLQLFVLLFQSFIFSLQLWNSSLQNCTSCFLHFAKFQTDSLSFVYHAIWVISDCWLAKSVLAAFDWLAVSAFFSKTKMQANIPIISFT